MGHPAGRWARPLRAALGIGSVALLGAATPACFFPEFTFDDNTGGSGATTSTPTTTSEGGGGTTTTSSSSEGGGGTTTTSEGGGGSMTTTTTSEGGGGAGGEGGGGMGGEGGTMTTSSSTTTSTMPPVENCQNGVDDDGDMLIDCKDTEDCADYTCAPSIPAGWTGYFLLYEGTLLQDPGCIEDFPTEDYVGSNNLLAPPAECTACTCGAPQGEVCTPASSFTVSDAPCGSPPTLIGPMNMPFGWTGTCAHWLNSQGQPQVWTNEFACGPTGTGQCNVSISGAGPTVTGGFCMPSGGQASIAPAEWQTFGRSCGGVETTGKGCNLNQVCVPKPPPPFVDGLCIKKAGDTNCPSGVSLFKEKHIFYANFDDSRTCTGCSCGPDQGATCAGIYSVYSDTAVNQCNQFAEAFQAGQCLNFTNNPVVGPMTFEVTVPPSGGSCQAQGGLSVGQATPTFPTTFCCME